MELQELYNEMAKLVAEMQTFLDEHEDEEGNLPEEDTPAYDKMDKKLVALRKKIDRQEKIARANAFLSEPVNHQKPILEQPDSNNPFAGKVGRASDEYRKAALVAIRSKFRNVSNALATNPDTSGGYLIPDEWDSRLIETLTEECIMRSLATIVPTSGEHKINFPTSKPTATWTAEGARVPDSTATFGQVSVDAYKLGVKI